MFGLFFAISFIGSIPPGVVNFAVLDASRRSYVNALYVIFFVVCSEASYVSVLWHVFPVLEWLKDPILRKVVYLTLAAFLFFITARAAMAKKTHKDNAISWKQGAILSLCNVLPIPFWTTVLGDKQFQSETLEFTPIILGIMCGTGVWMLLLAYLGRYVQKYWNTARPILSAIHFAYAAYLVYQAFA